MPAINVILVLTRTRAPFRRLVSWLQLGYSAYIHIQEDSYTYCTHPKWQPVNYNHLRNQNNKVPNALTWYT